MLQMGFIQKWLTEYLPKKDRCSKNGRANEIENHTVNLADMQGCFLVLIAGKLNRFKAAYFIYCSCEKSFLHFAGIAASIIIMLFECCCHKKKVLTHKKLIIPFVK